MALPVVSEPDWIDQRASAAMDELRRLDAVVSYREQVLRQSQKLASVAVRLAEQRIETLTLEEEAKQAEAKARKAIAERKEAEAKTPAPPPDARLSTLLDLASRLERENAQMAADNARLRRQLLDDEDDL